MRRRQKLKIKKRGAERSDGSCGREFSGTDRGCSRRRTFYGRREASGDSDGAATGEEASAAQEETQSLDENEVPAAEAATAKAVGVESYYDIYDSYNDPKKGTDATVKGKNIPLHNHSGRAEPEHRMDQDLCSGHRKPSMQVAESSMRNCIWTGTT